MPQVLGNMHLVRTLLNTTSKLKNMLQDGEDERSDL